MVRKMGVGLDEKLVCQQPRGTPAIMDPNALRYTSSVLVHAVGLLAVFVQ